MNRLDAAASQPPSASLRSLRQALRGLGEALRDVSPPAALRQRVLTACETARQTPVVPAAAGIASAASLPTPVLPTNRGARWAARLGLTTSVLVVSAGAVFISASPSQPVVATVGAPVAEATAFLPLVPMERLGQLAREPQPEGPPWVVTTELPRERLAALGLPYDASRRRAGAG
jgi:hypothetical protein